MPSLLFFAPSLPDETIQSRVARHHVLSGNRTEADTFLDLFDSPPFTLEQIVPPGLARLAARLSDDPDAALKMLLEQNTLLPLFAPFLGEGSDSQSASLTAEAALSRLPRRVVGMHGEAQLCTACAVEDVRDHGMAYWRRAHHVPGVSVCWIHQLTLLSSCPGCRRPFQFHNRLLRQPWHACPCGWQAVAWEQSGPVAETVALDYARFAHDLLDRPLDRTTSECLRATYRRRIRELGFAYGAGLRIREFQAHLIEELGDAFLASVDPAYAARRMRFWLRFTPQGGAAWDMPITRHLLLSLFLFGTRDRFALSLQRGEADTLPVRRTRSAADSPDLSGETGAPMPRAVHRSRIQAELARNPAMTIEDLWRKAHRPTAWLYDHDRAWLSNAMSLPLELAKQPADVLTAVSPDDAIFAVKVDAVAADVLAAVGKPLQVTKSRLFDALPRRLADIASHRARYPMTLARIAENRESTWHFRARRTWWAYGVLATRGDLLSINNAAVVSGVGYEAVRAIVEHCGWAPLLQRAAQLDVMVQLAAAGISRQWDGPPEFRGRAVGGRSYQRRRVAAFPVYD
ncbi:MULTISPECIES: TniQ family protein [Paraburkholderia]|uniref:TniQ family protein n=1 Tax=Paraburkholderia madseniana TaxID=2599607 RepID=A0AAP5F006_9BURK|nr:MULTISPECIES: TniQ family protein [Paraburkholderia]MCX4151653.1 TniQ family protein [Paraburkholderia madseniana]MCX4176927.1 TniQ family protein [Paraburkholderia madseniana]MDN7154582.1 TnsD family transposase [Paraburkholderia sp. WS6]MDQ6413465.1 TnsD family transposase [Paraburkholderia madseniana]MDQ6464918.1 TnsD family transposase [Paraburkholderia madseniana]